MGVFDTTVGNYAWDQQNLGVVFGSYEENRQDLRRADGKPPQPNDLWPEHRFWLQECFVLVLFLLWNAILFFAFVFSIRVDGLLNGLWSGLAPADADSVSLGLATL